MKKQRYWWPLDISDHLEIELAEHEHRLNSESTPLDTQVAERTASLLSGFIAAPARTIISRDSLPWLCHLFTGWGNAKIDGEPLLSRLAPFVHLDPLDQPYIYQCHPEGDFHPWQTFAYCMMAGIDPDARIGALPFSLKDVARGSTLIRTSSMDDLGHLLLSHAEMGLPTDMQFTFRGPLLKCEQTMDLLDMVKAAIQAHHFGPFFVCRKFHLTEGLCAIVAKHQELAPLRPTVQKFLDGQMDVLLTLSLAVERIEAISRGELDAKDSSLPTLRKALLIGSLLENHIYTAGHLIELASLAIRYGFKVRPSHQEAVRRVLNHTNIAIQGAWTNFSPMAAFLPLSHYRRALTMQLELQRNLAALSKCENLRVYWSDLDAPSAPSPMRPSELDNLYTRAPHSQEVRELFADVLQEFSQANTTGMEPQGGFSHFRRLHPEHWPRQLHFEFLDYGHHIGVELHFENSDLMGLLDAIVPQIAELNALELGAPVEVLRHHDASNGRLRLYFENHHGAVSIAQAMCRFVQVLLPTVETALADPVNGVNRIRAVSKAGGSPNQAAGT